MRRLALLTVAAMSLIVAPASAYQFHFVTPLAHQSAVQRVLSVQLNKQVAKHWRIDPVSFAATGIPIIIEPSAMVAADCGRTDALGCHATDRPQPVIYITAGNWRTEVLDVSHEMIEVETDEWASNYLYGLRAEACDPVNESPYQVMGMTVADFVYPRWFSTQSHGQMDWEGVLARPRTGYQGGRID